MQVAGTKIFCFEGFTLDLQRGCLRQDESEIKLRPKSFTLLHYLLENAGRLVAKDELVKAMWKRAVVTDESLARCISDVRLALGDVEQQIIKTVPRRGYLVAAPVCEARSVPYVPVHQGEVVPAGDDLLGDGVIVADRLEPLAEPGDVYTSSRMRGDTAGNFAFDAEGLSPRPLKNTAQPIRVYLVHPCAPERPTLTLPDKPSLVVLPFLNMSGDAAQEYFADGMVEDITTALSRVRSLFVIARNSAFTYKGRAVDVRQVGRELGVRYVLEGSIRTAESRLRVTGKLIDATTGAHLWAERYDRKIADIFAIQDEITEAVVAAIEPVLAAAERQRARRKAPENLGIWELYHRGLWHLFKYTPEDCRLALEFLQKAVSLDPGNATVHAGLGMAYISCGLAFAPQERAIWLASGLEHRGIATSLDPLDATAHALFGHGLLLAGKHEAALKETTQAVVLNPSNATVQNLHAVVLTWSGRPGDSLPHLKQAFRLSPLDPMRWRWIDVSSMAHYFLRDYEGCVAAGREVCRMQPNLVFGYRALLVALAELGRIDEAHQFADVIHTRFNNEIRTFLTTRNLEWPETEYTACVASFAKGGLVLRDGELARVD